MCICIILISLNNYLNIAKMIVVGNRPTQDHFSKVSIHNFSGLKKYKKRVYRNGRKNLPWDFWEVSWVSLFPTTAIYHLLLSRSVTDHNFSFILYEKFEIPGDWGCIPTYRRTMYEKELNLRSVNPQYMRWFQVITIFQAPWFQKIKVYPQFPQCFQS